MYVFVVFLPILCYMHVRTYVSPSKSCIFHYPSQIMYICEISPTRPHLHVRHHVHRHRYTMYQILIGTEMVTSPDTVVMDTLVSVQRN